MRSLKLLLGSAALISILALGACNKEDSEAKYASKASISSEDSCFTATSTGGTISFKAEGGEVVVSVDCGTDWTWTCDGEWLAFTSTAGTLTVKAVQNTVEKEQTATVTLMTSGEGLRFATIDVTQDGKAYLNLNGETASFYCYKGSASFTIESNYEIINDNSASWLTVSVSGQTLTVSVSENDGDTREAVVTFTAGDGAENVANAQLSVSQLSVKTMVLVYTTAEASTEVILPLYDDVSCTVDWGDGSDSESVTAALPSHTYADAGEYVVKIDGTVSSLYSNSTNKDVSALLTSVEQWGKTGLTSMYYAFYNCSGLASIPDDTAGAFTEVESYQRAFCNCTSLTEIPAGLFANSPKATNFSYAFDACGVITVPAGLCKGLTNVTTFQYVFAECPALTTVESEAFAGCAAATTFKNAFKSSTSLTSITGDIFKGCAAVTDMSYVFYQCPLPTIPSGIFDDCTKVTTFNSTFYDNASLTAVPEGLFDNSPDVTDFAYCFRNNTSLTTVPVDLFDNCKKVTKFSVTFYNCSNWVGESPYSVIDGQKIHLYERTTDLGFSSITLSTSCFYQCTGLTDYNDIPSKWGGE